MLIVENPIEAPAPELILQWQEAIVTATIITPFDYSRGVKALCDERRGVM